MKRESGGRKTTVVCAQIDTTTLQREQERERERIYKLLYVFGVCDVNVINKKKLRQRYPGDNNKN